MSLIMMKPDDPSPAIAFCETPLYSGLCKRVLLGGLETLMARNSKILFREIERGDLLSLSYRQWIPPCLIIVSRRTGEKVAFGVQIFTGSLPMLFPDLRSG